MTEALAGQLSIFDLGLWSGKTSPEHCQAESRKERTSESSSKRPRESQIRLPLFLDLRGGQKWTTSGCILGDGWSIAWRIHDAQFWGAPQRRRRIALVADFAGESAPEILFERKGLSGDPEQSEQAGEGTAEGTPGSIGETSEGVKKQTAFGISAYESNAMKSSNPHSGCYKADTSRTLDNNGGNPTCNQGGVAILEGNGARNSHRGDGYRIGETSYTLNTVEVHAVAVDVRNGVENERTNGTLQAKPNGGMNLNCNNVVRETTGVDVYNGETTGETAVTLTAHAGGGTRQDPKC